MITISDILTPKRVLLEVTSTTREAAILEVAQLLRGDERVRDWNAFVGAIKVGSSCIATESGRGICIPHARTNQVSTMVMAAGRSTNGIWFEGEGGSRVLAHYIIVIGVPVALAADYLRIIGAIARTFRSAKSEAALRAAGTKEEFIRLLAINESPV